MANAILLITYIRSINITDQTKFIENSQNCKQLGKFLDMPKRPQAPKTHFLGLEYEKSGNHVAILEIFETYEKDAHANSVQNGSDAFQNELTRFRFEATPIWEQIQKRRKNAVII